MVVSRCHQDGQRSLSSVTHNVVLCGLGGALLTETVRHSQRRELEEGSTHSLQRQHDVTPICENLITDSSTRQSRKIKELSGGSRATIEDGIRA